MKFLEEAMGRIEAEGLYRRLRNVSSPQEAEIILDGSRVINFSGNNALGLATHPAVVEAARKGIERFGVGSGASRLISGNMAPHEDLETALASFLGSERALLFASGYQANTGAIPVLAPDGGVILSDEFNHASLIDGIRLSRADRIVYPHNDVAVLGQRLEEIPAERPVTVVTESLFSMEGDRAPLRQIVALKKIRPFLLYVDEAHALGAAGPGGRGFAAGPESAGGADVVLGTLGKAFGVSGAFIASSQPIVELLINRARPFIYSTAPAPLLARASLAALEEVKEGDGLRERLKNNAASFRARVEEITGVAPAGQDHIIPVRLPGADRVMEASEGLLERGIFCQGIRPPTVPAGACRLRFSISALHRDAHLVKAARALREVLAAH